MATAAAVTICPTPTPQGIRCVGARQIRGRNAPPGNCTPMPSPEIPGSLFRSQYAGAMTAKFLQMSADQGGHKHAALGCWWPWSEVVQPRLGKTSQGRPEGAIDSWHGCRFAVAAQRLTPLLLRLVCVAMGQSTEKQWEHREQWEQIAGSQCGRGSPGSIVVPTFSSLSGNSGNKSGPSPTPCADWRGTLTPRIFCADVCRKPRSDLANNGRISACLNTSSHNFREPGAPVEG